MAANLGFCGHPTAKIIEQANYTSEYYMQNLNVFLENIPEELKRERRWVVWRYEDRCGPKLTKVPYNAARLLEIISEGTEPRNCRADSSNAGTWSDYDTAVKCLPHAHGIGFVLGDGWAGFDLDNCVSEAGELHPDFRLDVACLNTYTEISPSGSGVKGILRGKLPDDKGRKHGAREAYSARRFFTVTGRHLPFTPNKVHDRQQELDGFVKLRFPEANTKTTLTTTRTPSVGVADSAILATAFAAKNGDKLRALFEADVGGITGKLGFAKADGSPDWSQAVASFLFRVAFYTQDAEQLDRLFRASKLFDEWEHKWDRLGEDEIGRAVAAQTEVYHWPTYSPDVSDVCGEIDQDETTGTEPTIGTTAHGPNPTGVNKPTTAQLLVNLADGGGDLWRSTDGSVWATVDVDGHSENWPLRSPRFRSWLTGRYWDAKHDAPNEKAIKGAVEVLEHRASRGPEHRVFLRYARLNDRLYIDLGGPTWDAVEVSPDGWKIVTRPPVKFRRTKNTGGMPTPERGGKADLLRKVLPVSESAWALVLGYLLDAMKGRGPFFLMSAHGEQGSAKSTVCRLVRRLVDPLSKVELSALPRDEESLAVDGRAEYLLAYDNVSHLPQWLSDAFCRVATGGGLKVRTLYTNDEQTVLDVCAPVVLNGIPDFAEANDLLGRSLIVRLPRISDEDRRDEADVFGEFEAVRPLVFGALLDLVAAGLKRLPTVKLSRLPRMADSVKWVTACLGDASFATEYARNVEEAAEIGFEASPVADMIAELVTEADGTWKGTAGELLNELRLLHPDRGRQKGFPQTARWLGDRLKRDAPALRTKGIDYMTGKTNGVRWVSFDTMHVPHTDGAPNLINHSVGRVDAGTTGTMQGRCENASSTLSKPLENKANHPGRDDRDDDFLLFRERGRGRSVDDVDDGTAGGGGSDSESRKIIVPVVPVALENDVLPYFSRVSGRVDGRVDAGSMTVTEGTSPERPTNNGSPHSSVIVQPQVDESRPSHREAVRLARNLSIEFAGGFVVMPTPRNLSVWKWGQTDENGNRTFYRGDGSMDWAIAEVRRRLPAPQPSSQGDRPEPTAKKIEPAYELTDEEFDAWAKDLFVSFG